jgi:hypothetical protein
MGKQIILAKRAGRKAADARNKAYNELSLDDKMLTNPARFQATPDGNSIDHTPRSVRRAECKAKKKQGKPADYSKRVKVFATRLPKKSNGDFVVESVEAVQLATLDGLPHVQTETVNE